MIDVIKSSVDRREIGDLIGGLGKADAFSICNQLFPLVVDADSKIVVQFFTARTGESPQKKNPSRHRTPDELCH